VELLLPFILLIGVMLLMTRSAKNKQRQAVEMRNSMEPGTGVRTIGGMYALVKEVHEDTVLVEVSPGVHVHFAKNAIGAVLETEEYERIISGEPLYDEEESPVVPDDASALTEDERVQLDKDDSPEDDKPQGSTGDGENGSKS
jgi:preprotein translocase subunit YajC